jgi:hypothetical protein
VLETLEVRGDKALARKLVLVKEVRVLLELARGTVLVFLLGNFDCG